MPACVPRELCPSSSCIVSPHANLKSTNVTPPRGTCAGVVGDVDFRLAWGETTHDDDTTPEGPCWHCRRRGRCSRTTNTTPKGVVLVLYDGCSERASTTPEGTMHSMLISVGETTHGDDGHNSRGTMHACSHCRHRGHSSRPTNATPKGPAR